VDAVALASVLERPWADVVLSGASTVEQLRANVAATEVALDDEARHALAGLAMPVDAYWRSRVELPWT
jgi:aryl-alcohol dehydrogenase-like predicted oxidoreductase